MATSSTYIITLTAGQLITAALKDFNAIDASETPSGSEMADGVQALNFILFESKGPPNPLEIGEKMWQRETGTLGLDEEKAAWTLKPTGGDYDIQIPIEILSAVRRNSSNIDTPMQPMTRNEYMAIGSKTAVGTPTKYHYTRTPTEGTLYLNREPSVLTDSFVFVYRQPLEIITAHTQTLDMENYFYRMLKHELAIELAGSYGLEIGATLAGKADRSRTKAQSFQYEENEPVFFEPGRDD